MPGSSSSSGRPLEDSSYVAIVIGILVPAIVFLCVVVVVCVRRLRGQSANPGYAQVQHQLDEEEIEFKRFIESQHTGGGDEEWGSGMDDIDAFFESSLSLDDTTHESSIDAESLQFDEEERNHLSILERFRAQLITSSQGGEDKEDEEGHEATANPLAANEPPDETRL